MKNIEGVLGGTAYKGKVTTTEIRHIIGNWEAGFDRIVTFYQRDVNGILREFTDIDILRKWFKK